MFKLIRQLFCLATLAVVGFVALSLMKGGDPFRDFGLTVKQRSDQAAQAADAIRDTYQNIKGPAKKTVKAIKETGETIRKVTGETAEKTASKVEETGERAVEAAEETTGKAADAVEAAGRKLKSLKADDAPETGAAGEPAEPRG